MLPVCAFLFACSIARIGITVLPMTTNISWALAYVCVIPIIAAKPNVYLSLARRNSIFLAAGIFAVVSSFWSLTPSLSAYFGMLFLLNVVVGVVIVESVGISAVIRFVFWFCFLIQGVSLILALGHASVAIDPSGNGHALWVSAALGGDATVRAARFRRDSGLFDTPGVVSAEASVSPTLTRGQRSGNDNCQLAVDAQGRAIAIWAAPDGGIWATRFE